jgi:hypothetical protein
MVFGRFFSLGLGIFFRPHIVMIMTYRATAFRSVSLDGKANWTGSVILDEYLIAISRYQ